ncbi:hypothetical protein COBT_002400 [Conglomerata obtusa]
MKIKMQFFILIAHQCYASNYVIKVDERILPEKCEPLSKDYMLYSYTISPYNYEENLAELVEQIKYAMKKIIRADDDRKITICQVITAESQKLQNNFGVNFARNNFTNFDSNQPSLKKLDDQFVNAQNPDDNQPNVKKDIKSLFDSTLIYETVYNAGTAVKFLKDAIDNKCPIHCPHRNYSLDNILPLNSTTIGFFIFSFVDLNDKTTEELNKYISSLLSIRKTHQINAKILFFMDTKHVKDVDNLTFEDLANEVKFEGDCVTSHLLYGIDVMTYSKNYQVNRFVTTSFDSSMFKKKDITK